jgi:hypothetical protein
LRGPSAPRARRDLAMKSRDMCRDGDCAPHRMCLEIVE